MKLGHSDPLPEVHDPRLTRTVERQTPSNPTLGLEAIWPRRFDLDAIKALLGKEADQLILDVLASRVNAPIWSLVDRGGGRWRPTICRQAFLVSGGTAPAPEGICQVAELLHTGSLIIDDIQDGSEERRGGPAAHVVYGMPTAVNAANAAYFRALEMLRGSLPDDLRLRALDMLAEELFAAHLGQALDLALGARLKSAATLETAHYLVLARAKTGALVRIAARLGAIAADADPTHEAALGEWASELGVAYQIRNDLDDVLRDMHDLVARRPSYPILLVMEDDGPAAAMLRARFGQSTLTAADVGELRDLLARERVVERGGAAARLAAGRALDALRYCPAIEARTALERITYELAGDPPRA
jgi:geranylgeranyl pyrophosphate synthase